MEMSNGHMFSNIETITPDRAKLLLEHSDYKNRSINPDFVDYLVREIACGNWKTTHQGIALDDNGNVTDGHHRLNAIVKSNTPVVIMVTHGITKEASLTAVDQGKARSRSQLFTMRGETNAGSKASICRAIGLLTTPDLAYGKPVGPSEDVKILDNYRNEIELVIDNYAGIKPRQSAKLLAVIAVLYRAMPRMAIEFAQGVVVGVNLSDGDPRLTLRNWLLGGNTDRSGNGVDIVTKSSCAAAAFIDGDKVEAARLSANRFLRFCELAKILPPNRSLLAYCGGRIIPSKLRSNNQ